MPSLQIRDVPDPLHQLLLQRAKAHRRSLGQQALHDLEQVSGGDAQQRRLLALTTIRQLWHNKRTITWEQPPEELIRRDRER